MPTIKREILLPVSIKYHMDPREPENNWPGNVDIESITVLDHEGNPLCKLPITQMCNVEMDQALDEMCCEDNAERKRDAAEYAGEEREMFDSEREAHSILTDKLFQSIDSVHMENKNHIIRAEKMRMK